MPVNPKKKNPIREIPVEPEEEEDNGLGLAWEHDFPIDDPETLWRVADSYERAGAMFTVSDWFLSQEEAEGHVKEVQRKTGRRPFITKYEKG